MVFDFGYFERYDIENALARKFYKQFDYVVPERYDFHLSQHPTEIAVLNMARIAIDEITEICSQKMAAYSEDNGDNCWS